MRVARPLMVDIPRDVHRVLEPYVRNMTIHFYWSPIIPVVTFRVTQANTPVSRFPVALLTWAGVFHTELVTISNTRRYEEFLAVLDGLFNQPRLAP
jgi:hypothetical protein